uniref:NADH-ubiquinone oxidoreductase chain 3 n=1 Tax=Acanthopleura vaillantii TaxID=1169768 RepID=A0AA51NHE8_9MOLL|nr:NADH dehydrogenase subunit 3 [Acanthopleura vaillantii]WMQ53050.1 NADH dehydrogenase subunit 3 [Acanthopleura vaillantii]
MKLLTSFLLFNLSLCVFLSMLAIFITKKKEESREKSSPFECGFDPKSNSRLPFSMRFFLITVIFLIFDVEIVLLLPYLISNNSSADVFSLTTAVFVILVLLLGTLHEWSQGSLKWTTS